MANILSQDELDSLLQEMKQLQDDTSKVENTQDPIPPIEKVQHQASTPSDVNLELALSIRVRVSAELGRTYITGHELLRLTPGATIPLNTKADDTLLKLTVKDQVIAYGETVVKNDRFALRLTKVNPTKELINKLKS
jgi:flagellar motor switch/type III secretory pathway protein FliN